MSRRAMAPVFATVLLFAVVTLLAGTVFGLTTMSEPVAYEPIAIEVNASPETDASHATIQITHNGGPTLDLTDIELRIFVDDVPLKTQVTTLPVMGHDGFARIKRAFHLWSGTTWSPGETGEVDVARWNEPTISSGAIVRVQVVLGETVIGEGETVAL